MSNSLPEEIEETLERICHNLVVVWVEFRSIKPLTHERRGRPNPFRQCAPNTCHLLHNIYYGHLVLRLCRFYDEPAQHRRENCSLRRLRELLERHCHTQQVVVLDSFFQRHESLIGKLKAARNRRIAHLDMNVVRGTELLPDIRYADVNRLLAETTRAVKQVNYELTRCAIQFKSAMLRDSGHDVLRQLDPDYARRRGGDNWMRGF